MKYAEYVQGWKMRTGEWIVAPTTYPEYVGSGKMRSGDWVVQLRDAE